MMPSSGSPPGQGSRLDPIHSKTSGSARARRLVLAATSAPTRVTAGLSSLAHTAPPRRLPPPLPRHPQVATLQPKASPPVLGPPALPAARRSERSDGCLRFGSSCSISSSSSSICSSSSRSCSGSRLSSSAVSFFPLSTQPPLPSSPRLPSPKIKSHSPKVPVVRTPRGPVEPASFPKPHKSHHQTGTGGLPPFPTICAVSYNICSFSEDASSPALKSRRTRVQENIRSVCHNADVIFLQETRASASGYASFMKPTFISYPNPNPVVKNSGGTEILINAAFASRHHILSVVTLPGYIQCVTLVPKTAQGKLDHEKTLLLINGYLPSGNSPEAQARRCSALEALCQAKALPPKYVVAGGDWNLVEHECDSSGQGHFASTPEMLRVFRKFLNHFGLHEVYQPTHTRIQGQNSARLDRFYISHPLPDQLLHAPLVSFPRTRT